MWSNVDHLKISDNLRWCPMISSGPMVTLKFCLFAPGRDGCSRANHWESLGARKFEDPRTASHRIPRAQMSKAYIYHLESREICLEPCLEMFLETVNYFYVNAKAGISINVSCP